MSKGAFLIVLFGMTLVAGFACTSRPSSESLRVGSAQNVVYGDNNRQEYYELSDPNWQALGGVVGVLVDQSAVMSMSGSYAFVAQTMDEWSQGKYGKPLCDDQEIHNQVFPGFCTGFMISSHVMLTAAHCLDGRNIGDIRIVMNFVQPGPSTFNSFEASQVYLVSNVLYQVNQNQTDSSGRDEANDFAFLQLDRAVPAQAYFGLGSDKDLQVGDPLLMVGYSNGLPLKWTDGAQVSRISDMLFSANLDSLPGDSGSPVINLRTGMIAGLLRSGPTVTDFDYESDDDCMEETLLPETGSSAGELEHVLRMSQILAATPPDIFKQIQQIEGIQDTQ